MLILAPLGDSPFAPECNFTFSQISRRGTTFLLLLFLLLLGHSHFLCPFSSHTKHLTSTSSITFCFLTSFTPHYITQFPNTLNLLLGTVFFFCSFPHLQFGARCPNFPHLLHSFPFLPSNSALNLARACLWLSILLIRLLYCSRDIVLCSGWMICFVKKRIIFVEGASFSSKGL